MGLFCPEVVGFAAGLLPRLLELGLLEAVPLPVSVMRSLTLRFPANELAMRRAVSFSLPFCTLPLSSIVVSVTLTLTLSLRKVGSFCRAV